jgi:hypothetical protein
MLALQWWGLKALCGGLAGMNLFHFQPPCALIIIVALHLHLKTPQQGPPIATPAAQLMFVPIGVWVVGLGWLGPQLLGWFTTGHSPHSTSPAPSKDRWRSSGPAWARAPV